MKTVLITGASSGIGLSLAELYAANGFHVIACGRNKSNLELLINNIQAKGCSAEYLCFDITDKLAIEQVAKHVSKPIDILLLNAGDCEYIKDTIPFDNALFERVINVNLVSLGHMLTYFLDKIPCGGQLVFVSSIATVMPFPQAHAYGASKAGVDYLANTLRFDLLSQDIAVTLIHPGFVKTPLTDKNDFSMPCLLSTTEAAQRIFKGINARKSYLAFPKRFVYALKVLSLMPNFLWYRLVFKGSHS